MRYLLYATALSLLFAACGQPNSNSDKPNTETNTSEDPNKTNEAPKVLSKLDSIDKANNKAILAEGDNATKAFVQRKKGDNSILLSGGKTESHRFFGYAKPDVHSERLLLLSVFTSDVENNPFKCKLGAYYDTDGMEDLDLKYISTKGDFIEATATDASKKSTTIYFEKKWIDFD